MLILTVETIVIKLTTTNVENIELMSVKIIIYK